MRTLRRGLFMDDMLSRGAICSLEGISGVGKSYLIQALRPALADLPVTFLSEVVDRTGQDLDRDIIALLAKRGDPPTPTYSDKGVGVLAYRLFAARKRRSLRIECNS